MAPLFVVLPHLLRTDLAHLLQRINHVRIKHLIAVRPIEPLHKGILIRLARLNMPQCDPAIGEELLTIAKPNGLRLSLPGSHLLQHLNHSLGGQRRIHFDR